MFFCHFEGQFWWLMKIIDFAYLQSPFFSSSSSFFSKVSFCSCFNFIFFIVPHHNYTTIYCTATVIIKKTCADTWNFCSLTIHPAKTSAILVKMVLYHLAVLKRWKAWAHILKRLKRVRTSPILEPIVPFIWFLIFKLFVLGAGN